MSLSVKYTLLFLVSLVLAGVANPSRAATPCTNVQTAAVSHFVTHNTGYGGHVLAHIRGAVPPHGFTQTGKTLFRDGHDYDDAWTELSQQNVPLQCSDNPQLGDEAARDIAVQFYSIQCTAAGGNGACTAGNEIQTHWATFIFRAVNLHGHVRWILYTAYPRQ